VARSAVLLHDAQPAVRSVPKTSVRYVLSQDTVSPTAKQQVRGRIAQLDGPASPVL
jgi:hypothetical protein